MAPSAEPRAKGVVLPHWWREKFLAILGRRTESLGQLGRMLSAAVDRDEAWDHGSVSRFISNKVTTAPMAEAFSILFGLPRPFYEPRTIEEALEMQNVWHCPNLISAIVSHHSRPTVGACRSSPRAKHGAATPSQRRSSANSATGSTWMSARTFAALWST